MVYFSAHIAQLPWNASEFYIFSFIWEGWRTNYSSWEQDQSEEVGWIYNKLALTLCHKYIQRNSLYISVNWILYTNQKMCNWSGSPPPPEKNSSPLLDQDIFLPQFEKGLFTIFTSIQSLFWQRCCSKWGWVPREQQSRGWWQSAEMSQPKEQVCICICIWRWIHSVFWLSNQSYIAIIF